LIELTADRRCRVRNAWSPKISFSAACASSNVPSTASASTLSAPGAGHLPLLQRRDAAVRIEDENRGAGLAQQAVDRRRPGVARRRAEDIDRLAPHPALVLVEIAQQLEGEILERQRGAVEELEHVRAFVRAASGAMSGCAKPV
jgi:hypothetical protein